ALVQGSDVELPHIAGEQAMAVGRRQCRERWQRGGLRPETRRPRAVVGRLVAQQAVADRAAVSGTQRDVENDEAASSSQDLGLRKNVLFFRRGEVLHRQIDAAELEVGVE